MLVQRWLEKVALGINHGCLYHLVHRSEFLCSELGSGGTKTGPRFLGEAKSYLPRLGSSSALATVSLIQLIDHIVNSFQPP